MGRHKRSIEEHVRLGTYRPWVHGPLDTNKFGVSDPLKDDPPDTLDAWGLEVWRELYPVVTASGAVTQSERHLFVLYCDAAGVVAEAMAELRAHGKMNKRRAKNGARDQSKMRSDLDDGPQTRETGATVSPWVKIKRDAADDVAKFARLLGLTSIDRVKVARIKTGGEKEEKKPLPSSRPKSAFERLQQEGTG